MSRGRLAPVALLAALVVVTVGSAGCAPQVLTSTTREGLPLTSVPDPGGSGATTGPEDPSSSPSSEPSTPKPVSPATPAPTPEPSAPTGPTSIELAGTVTTGLPAPWGLAELPDGTVVVSTRDEHHLYRVVPRVGTIVDLGEVPGVESDGGEGGLLGVAVAADYSTTKRIYVYYSTLTDNRVAYVTLQPGSPATLSEPVDVLTGIPHGLDHNGGRLVFGPDDMLYVSTGDAEDPELAQDLDSLAGKILRITPAGSPAPGNPFGASPVYSYGHRDVQGLAFDDAGRLFASELGEGESDDELNWIRAGRNYGWPLTRDAAALPGLTAPLASFGSAAGSPSGVAIAAGSAWMAALQGERLWRFPLDGARLAATPSATLAGRLGRLRSVIALDESTLLVSTSNTDGRDSPRPGDDRLVLVRLS